MRLKHIIQIVGVLIAGTCFNVSLTAATKHIHHGKVVHPQNAAYRNYQYPPQMMQAYPQQMMNAAQYQSPGVYVYNVLNQALHGYFVAHPQEAAKIIDRVVDQSTQYWAARMAAEQQVRAPQKDKKEEAKPQPVDPKKVDDVRKTLQRDLAANPQKANAVVDRVLDRSVRYLMMTPQAFKAADIKLTPKVTVEQVKKALKKHPQIVKKAVDWSFYGDAKVTPRKEVVAQHPVARHAVQYQSPGVYIEDIGKYLKKNPKVLKDWKKAAEYKTPGLYVMDVGAYLMKHHTTLAHWKKAAEYKHPGVYLFEVGRYLTMYPGTLAHWKKATDYKAPGVYLKKLGHYLNSQEKLSK